MGGGWGEVNIILMQQHKFAVTAFGQCRTVQYMGIVPLKRAHEEAIVRPRVPLHTLTIFVNGGQNQFCRITKEKVACNPPFFCMKSKRLSRNSFLSASCDKL